MGIDDHNRPRPSYPYVGEYESGLEVLFVGVLTGYCIKEPRNPGKYSATVGQFADDWLEDKATPVVRSVTFDLS